MNINTPPHILLSSDSLQTNRLEKGKLALIASTSRSNEAGRGEFAVDEPELLEGEEACVLARGWAVATGSRPSQPGPGGSRLG
jgi:hypothetical protein